MIVKKTLPFLMILGLVPAVLCAQAEATAVEAEIVIATGIEDREPVGGSTSFSEDVGQVTGWTKVSGAQNTTIEHVWKYRDHEFVVPLNIGNGSPWRIWSTKNIPPEWDGEWTFEVRDADGNVVASTTFTVGGSQ